MKTQEFEVPGEVKQQSNIHTLTVTNGIRAREWLVNTYPFAKKMNFFAYFKKVIAPLVITSTLLGACSNPTAYQVNPKPDQTEENQEVPESQQEGYMRIIGDLRWDNISSPKDLEKAFPGCLRESLYSDTSDIFVKTNYIYRAYNTNTRQGDSSHLSNISECRKEVGGITFSLYGADFEPDASSGRKQRLSKIVLYISREDHSRALDAILKSRFNDQADYKDGRRSERYCSPYTCWSRPFKWYYDSSKTFELTPTSKTTSILDNVSVNPNAF